jgi:HSP20 family protein
MQGNPMDMFDEMDEIFSRLFARMDRDYTNVIPEEEYCIIIRDDRDGPATGNITDDPASLSPVSSEPVVEVHRIGNEVRVITGLPGITDEALRLNLRGTILVIDAGDADHHYRASAELPPLDPASMQKTLKNGVLEVTFTAIPEESDQS